VGKDVESCGDNASQHPLGKRERCLSNKKGPENKYLHASSPPGTEKLNSDHPSAWLIVKKMVDTLTGFQYHSIIN